jgi:hypothetical protein
VAGSGYDNFAKQYARILARQGVELEIRYSAGAVENLDRLRDPLRIHAHSRPSASRNRPIRYLHSLGEYSMRRYLFFTEHGARYALPVPRQRLIGMRGTALRLLMLEVLKSH